MVCFSSTYMCSYLEHMQTLFFLVKSKKTRPGAPRGNPNIPFLPRYLILSTQYYSDTVNLNYIYSIYYDA